MKHTRSLYDLRIYIHTHMRARTHTYIYVGTCVGHLCGTCMSPMICHVHIQEPRSLVAPTTTPSVGLSFAGLEDA